MMAHKSKSNSLLFSSIFICSSLFLRFVWESHPIHCRLELKILTPTAFSFSRWRSYVCYSYLIAHSSCIYNIYWWKAIELIDKVFLSSRRRMIFARDERVKKLPNESEMMIRFTGIAFLFLFFSLVNHQIEQLESIMCTYTHTHIKWWQSICNVIKWSILSMRYIISIHILTIWLWIFIAFALSFLTMAITVLTDLRMRSSNFFAYRKIDDDHPCHPLLLLVFEMSDVYIHTHYATNRARLSSSISRVKQAANLSVSRVVAGSSYFHRLMILPGCQSKKKKITAHHSSSNQSIKQSPRLFFFPSLYSSRRTRIYIYIYTYALMPYSLPQECYFLWWDLSGINIYLYA